ncbi:MAG TPA: hypothetical protein VD902_10080 [Symbiobacteriaceae bacterium]|nr:hypothetical protein [Symbiobacteriaceae bacterium]
MAYDSDTFTYRGERSGRMPAPRGAADRPAAPRLTGWDRLAQLEAAVGRLEETVEQLGAVVKHLSEELDSRKARVHGAKPAVTVEEYVDEEPTRVAPRVVQTIQGKVEPPAPPPPPKDVKVSFFADGGTKAVVGQAKVIQQ